MKLHEMTAFELGEHLASGEVSAVDVTEAHFDRIDEVEEKVDAFLALTRDEAMEQAKQVDDLRAGGEEPGPLAGVPVAIKDVLCTRGVPTTCGSKILEGFRPPYDATTVRRCRDAGMPMVGKANMDEFAMGSSTENSAYKVTRNPWDLDRVPGGSSGGSAAAVAAGQVPIALGSDTGGSIRQPASLCGISGLKPTYGRVSRYGLIAYASSLDQVGPLAKDVRDCALAMNVLAGQDQRDATSADIDVPDYVEALTGDVTGLRAGVPKELMGEGIDPDVKATIEAAISELEDLGVAIEEVEMPNVDFSLPVYYLIATAEAASNLARFDGVRYGHRTEESLDDVYDLFAKSRGEGFGPEVRLRIMLGTFGLSAGYYDAYYLKAQKVRTLIKNDFDAAFEDHDVLLSPTSPTVAFEIGEKADDPLQMKLADICTIPVNLAGIPALSIPCGMADGMPVGLQIMGRPFEEDTIMRVGDAYQQATDWHTKRAEL